MFNGRPTSGRLYAGRLYADRLFRQPDTTPVDDAIRPRPLAFAGQRWRHPARAETRVKLTFSVSASAGLCVGASASTRQRVGVSSAAGLRVGAALRVNTKLAIDAGADMHDVVLEMLLLTS